MDISEVLAQAKRNQIEASGSKVSRYSTDVRPAKKLPRGKVNPKAIEAFLNRQREQENKKNFEAKKKKEALLKLRDASKNTKKANSMAKRTKDNLKVYQGEDILGLHQEPKKRRRGGPPSPILTPEEEKRHKAFMKNIDKLKISGLNDDSDDGYKEPMLEQDERKIRKMEKYRAKARSASNLEFSDLLQLAEKQKSKADVSDSSSDEESEEDSDSDTDQYGKPLTAEEKYQRERRKRRELQERLKMASTQKQQPSSTVNGNRHTKSSKSLSGFKIGKLDAGMSEENKRAKVKALMDKFKKSADSSSTKNSTKSDAKKLPSNSHSSNKNNSTQSVKDSHKRKHSLTNDHRKTDSSIMPKKMKKSDENLTTDQKIMSYLKQQQVLTSSAQKKENTKSSMSSSRNGVARSKPESLPTKKVTSTQQSSPQNIKKKQVNNHNPYKHTVVKAKAPPPTNGLIDPWARKKEDVKKKKLPPPVPGKCTLSITSESVRTNYPGVAKEDPYIQAYKKTGRVIQNFTPEMIAHYKIAMAQKLKDQGRPIPSSLNGNVRRRPPPPQKRRPGVIVDDSEDEYDSELEDFIADDDEEYDGDVDVSNHIKQIFGYDKSKYGRESEYELSKMDASYKDIEREEKRSLRIAREEDAREAKLEEERLKKKMKKRF